MKKLLAALLCAALVFTLMPMMARAAGSVDTPGYAFDATTGTLTIKSNTAIERVGVRYGDNHWRNDTNFSPDDVKAVNILNGVTEIGVVAFQNCAALSSVTIPNSVTSIGDSAFIGCSALTSVEIPDSVTSIGEIAFANCIALMSVEISNSVTSIGVYTFYGCTALTSVTIPNSVTSIGFAAFENCTALTSVEIPNSVTSIGRGAFYNCSSLTSVTIQNSVTSIGDAAFYDCSSLTSVTIPNSVTSIGYRAFTNCTALTSVTIPNSVTSIGYEAFFNCNRLALVLTGAVPPTFGVDWAYSVAAVCYPAAWGVPGSGLNLNYSGDAFATIDVAAIGGVTAPKRGAASVSAITETAQYTGTVTWSPADNPFAGETAYTATITLTPKAGYTLTGVAENFFTVAGAAATNAANSGVITAVFPLKAPKSVAQRTLTDSATGVMASGSGIRNGAKLTVNTINAQSLPAQMRQAIADGELIAGYDISLPGGFRGKITLSFPVSAAYEGQVVTILHYVNGRVETYTAVVENSVATVTVSKLSPFVILSTGVAVPDTIVTDPPKTGDTANPIGFVMLGLAALCSGYLEMKKRKA